MPVYEFRDVVTDELVEILMPWKESVPIGEVIEHEGREVRRTIECDSLPDIGKANYESLALSQAPWDPAFKRHDAQGNGITSSRAEMDEVTARSEGRIQRR